MTLALKSNDNLRTILQDHFNLLYIILSESKIVPHSAFEKINDIHRCLSGIPVPYHNAILGSPEKKEQWDSFIKEQLHYFNHAKTPFVWYLDENANIEFEEKLSSHGFQNAGVFQGVIGSLDSTTSPPQMPLDCLLELVKNEHAMKEFNDLVCATFAIQGISKDMYKKVLWNASQNHSMPMYHWMIRKDGRVISAVSTLIKNEIVSFWNGATLPEFRRQGLSTTLRRFALKDAVARGCRIGTSYLMSDGLALGICKKLGYQTKWRVNVFSSPSK